MAEAACMGLLSFPGVSLARREEAILRHNGSSSTPCILSTSSSFSSIQAPSSKLCSFSPLRVEQKQPLPVAGAAAAASSASETEAEQGNAPSGRIVRGKCYVLKDNIDTDQIIPAEYLTLLPSVPEEYEKLGSYAMAGLPEHLHPTRYVAPGSVKTEYPIIIAGGNFGCGSSREHAPVALGAAGCRSVVAQSYARIFFRNSVATGELYPVESEERLCDVIATGDEVTVDMEHDLVIHHPSGEQFVLRPLGEAGPVIDAGGIFNYARSTGMIAAMA
eukprot:TRINITY_DN1894_c0_g1_i1.p1 TRINITY_DN1894_c0_g1~~TRINITY_DN1894_c0_g1_i1.p1  ORF type:complete len:275 (+),score=44.39 TRINITY_DN1894_c0_g1_i1:124-948(+)